MNKDNASQFFSGLGIGLIVGAIVGLLIAPKSGKETRKVISDKAKEVKEKAQKVVKDIKHKIKPTTDGVHKE